MQGRHEPDTQSLATIASHQKVSINLSNILVVSRAHVKEAQHWVFVLRFGMDDVCAVVTMTVDLDGPVMSSDAGFSLAI